MNTKNVGSLEACQKLVDAGVVLETDCIWVKWYSDNYPQGEWRLMYKALIQVEEFTEQYPAPCFTEVWRELPEGIKVKCFLDGCLRQVYGSWAPLFVNKISCGSSAGYRIEHHIIVHFSSENPTDALIDLLIWVRKEQGNENIGII